MSTASLVLFLGIALTFAALMFFLVGLGRTVPLATWRRRKAVRGKDLERLRIVQRVDWQCAASLIGVALVAIAASRLGTGPAFTEPSGNAAGAVLLIAMIVFAVVLVTLFFRHVIVSRRLRTFDGRDY